MILVDDCSTDGSNKICDKFKKKDNGVKVIHKKNGGPSECRNVGEKIATGKHIGFIDKYDYLNENMYKILYETINNYDADIAQIGHFIVSDNKIIDRVYANGNYEFLEENMVVKSNIEDELINSFTCNKLYRKELFDEFEFINYSYHENLASMCILLSKSKKVYMYNTLLYYYV